VKITLKVKDFRAIADALELEAQEIISNVADALHKKAIDLATEKSDDPQKYIENLRLEKTSPNTYRLILDQEAAYLETGSKSRQMLPGLAQSSGKVSKDGHAYSVIPIEQSKSGSLGKQLAQVAKNRSFQKVSFGNSPFTGKFTIAEKLKSHRGIDSNLKNMVRLREFNNPTEKMAKTGNTKGSRANNVSFMTFRTASETQNPSESWVYPEKEGAKIFDELEQWLSSNLDNIIKKTLF
jgi:hypothetical protein